MRLFYFELRKNFLKRSVLLALLLFTIADVAKISNAYSLYGQFPGKDLKPMEQAYQTLYKEKLQGEMTKDKLDFVIGEYNRLQGEISDFTYSTEYDPNTYTGYIYGDYSLFKFEIYNPMNYAYSYRYENQDVVDRANKNVVFYEERGNRYEALKNQMIAKTYQDRSIRDFYNLTGFEALFQHDFSSLLILLLCVLALVPMFVSEKETEMDKLLLSGKKGRIPTTLAKLAASVLFVMMISLWFYGLDAFVFHIVFGLEGAGTPLYAIQMFSETPLNLSIGQFAMMSCVIKTLGIAVITGVMLLFSTLFSRVLLPFVFTIGFVFAIIYAGDSVEGLLNLVNPAALITNRELFGAFSVTDFGGYPVYDSVVSVLSGILTVTILVVLIIWINKRNLSLPDLRKIDSGFIRAKGGVVR